MSHRFWSTFGGLLLAGAAYTSAWHANLTSAQSWTAAVTTLCAAWWIFEALPLAATALVPLVAFPIAGVLRESQVGAAYGHPIVMLFLGAFMLSKAVERWGTHRRIAEAMMSWIGSTSGPRILFSLMLATALCSFWISNTAIALMMLPVAIAVLEHDESGKLATPLLLGVAYSASIGGIATPIGTAPNGVFLANYLTATGRSVTFDEWMVPGSLVAIVLLSVAWLVLARGVRGVSSVRIPIGGKWTTAQKRTLLVFGLAALAWVTRDVPLGGWSGQLPKLFGASAAGDATVAVAAALALFLVPSGERDGGRLLDWETAASIPWGVLILFGGGLAIGAAFESSGLSAVIGKTATGLQDWHPIAVIAVMCLSVALLSEFTSNTATANILMPVLAAAAAANGMEPALLMYPATLATSLAFMMPVGTPPNAIIYSSGRVRISDMVRYGFVLKIIGVVVVTLMSWWLLPVVFGVAG